MSLLDILHSKPLSIYSIPIVWFTAIFPNILKVGLIENNIGFNNVQPRENIARLGQKKVLAPGVAARAARMEGAHMNGNEALTLWIAAVLAGNFAGISTYQMNTVAVAYVSLRILYNLIYINHTSQTMSYVRSTVFSASTFLAMSLLVSAGNILWSRA